MYAIRMANCWFVSMVDFGANTGFMSPHEEEAMTFVNRENAEFVASRIPQATVEIFKNQIDASK